MATPSPVFEPERPFRVAMFFEAHEDHGHAESKIRREKAICRMAMAPVMDFTFTHTTIA